MLNGFMFGAASMGMFSPYSDVYNVITVLRQTKKNEKIITTREKTLIILFITFEIISIFLINNSK